MSENAYKYDVAFSFLSQDEPLALQLNDRLQDRLKTFIYTERQKELAGTDGEETFNRVFRQESRLVVVLYRAGWGDTKWTRVEQTAIRARGFDLGYDFAKFIPLDDPAIVPKWLPPTQIYIGLKRFGLDGAAAVIEQRARELGGNSHQETVGEHAQRVQRNMEFEQRREKFRRDPGAREAVQAVHQLPDLMREVCESIGRASKFRLIVQEEGTFFDRTLYVLGLRRVLSIQWKMEAANMLRNAELRAALLSHLPGGPGRFVIEQPTTSKSWRFRYDLLPGDVGGWTEGEARTYSTAELAERLVRLYLDYGGGD